MGRFFPFLAITMMAAMALAATAYPYKPSGFVPVSHVEKDGHVQYLGEFTVKRYNEQNHAYLKFIQVTEAQVLDRGTEHYTYKLVIKVHNGYAIKFYRSEILQDLSAPGHPPVLNIAYFMPL
uniref:Cystatin domain-containing protein n=1 Tax=Nymphaea colorata TaxID=210225 RepID=A0A5K1B1U2_9MAGN